MGIFSRKKKSDNAEKRSGPAFLSYSKKDREIALMLAQKLTKEGINIWYDQFEIEIGANWDVEIEKALNDAEAIICLLSPTSVESENVQNQYSYYIEKYGSDNVIIVTIGNPTLPMRLQRKVHVNLEDGLIETVEFIKSFSLKSGIEKIEKREKEVKSKGFIFISYAEEDSGFVEIIKAFMKKQNYGYWDYRDSERDYQTLLDNELENVIKKSEATLSILSDNWKKSDWSKKEYHFSNAIGKPVFLLRFEDMEPSLATAGIPYIDFSSSQDEGFAKLEIEFKKKNL